MSVIPIRKLPKPLWSKLRNSKDPIGISLLATYPKGIKLPIDIDRILSILGVNVGEISYPTRAFGGSVSDGKINARIEFNPALTENQRRFSLAYELSHIILHLSCVPYLDFHLFEDDKVANESLQFALDLLMPDSEVIEQYGELGGDIRSMSERFQVPGRLMRAKVEGLGRRESQCRNLKIQ